MEDIKNFFTIDVEGWSDRLAYGENTNGADKVYLEEVRTSCLIMMDILEETNNSATFFFLGRGIIGNEKLLQEIVSRGHEVGIHGFDHVVLFEHNQESFRQELQKTNDAIYDAIGRKATGYRAPRFSLNETTSWAIDVLIDQGFRYDASIYPAKSKYYRSEDAIKGPYRISGSSLVSEDESSSLLEFPIALRKTPFGYIPLKLRYFGYRFLTSSIASYNKNGIPATIFIHPWEIVSPPTKRTKTLKSIFRDYNIPCNNSLKRLLKSTSFCSIESELEKFL